MISFEELVLESLNKFTQIICSLQTPGLLIHNVPLIRQQFEELGMLWSSSRDLELEGIECVLNKAFAIESSLFGEEVVGGSVLIKEITSDLEVEQRESGLVGIIYAHAKPDIITLFGCLVEMLQGGIVICLDCFGFIKQDNLDFNLVNMLSKECVELKGKFFVS